MWNKILDFIKMYWLWGIVGIIIVSPLLVYLWNFHGYKISGDPNDWGVFGDFVGGVYSVIIAVLVVYLGRNLERRDEEKRVKQEALRAVYLQITNIQQNPQPNQNKVNKLFRLIDECKLYIDDDFYERLKELANYYVETGRNREMEKSIKDELKSEYGGKKIV